MRDGHFTVSTNYILFVVVALLTAVAWVNRFTFDDAYISFRYAQHFADGHGLVWNIGETPIEGYTNFLWTVLISIGFVLSIDPVLFSWGLSITCFVGSLLGTYLLARRLTNDSNWALLAVILLGTNFTFNTFATSGLETQSQAMLLIWSAYSIHRLTVAKSLSIRWYFISSLLFALALMTRLDSAIFIVGFGLIGIYVIWQSPSTIRDKTIAFLAFSLPSIVLIGGWLLWKISFYGDILPNTFYAKADTDFLPIVFKRGSLYIIAFWLSYWLLPLLMMITWRVYRRTTVSFEIALFGILLLWTLYLFYIGGDFMEFRFMVPILPFLILLIVMTIKQYAHQQWIQWLLIILVLAGSFSHSQTFHRYSHDLRMHSLQNMHNQHESPSIAWDSIGQVLGKALDYDRTVTLAVTPAGFIPFYARTRAIDMLGLNDAWIARNGVPHLVQAGHERIAPFTYLLEQDVNLLIDHPQMISNRIPIVLNSRTLDRFHVPVTQDDIPADSVYLVIPINDTHNLLTIYLQPHPAIDKAISEFGWQTYPTTPS